MAWSLYALRKSWLSCLTEMTEVEETIKPECLEETNNRIDNTSLNSGEKKLAAITCSPTKCY